MPVCVWVCVLVLATSKVRTFIRREDILAGPHVPKGLFKGRLGSEVGVRSGFRLSSGGWLGWLE